jgi:hypothetical protein
MWLVDNTKRLAELDALANVPAGDVEAEPTPMRELVEAMQQPSSHPVEALADEAVLSDSDISVAGEDRGFESSQRREWEEQAEFDRAANSLDAAAVTGPPLALAADREAEIQFSRQKWQPAFEAPFLREKALAGALASPARPAEAASASLETESSLALALGAAAGRLSDAGARLEKLFSAVRSLAVLKD